VLAGAGERIRLRLAEMWDAGNAMVSWPLVRTGVLGRSQREEAGVQIKIRNLSSWAEGGEVVSKLKLRAIQ
jgi:hypothetical protein